MLIKCASCGEIIGVAREHELYTGNTDYGDPEYNEMYGGEVDGEDPCVDCIDEAESDAGYYSGIYEDDDE